MELGGDRGPKKTFVSTFYIYIKPAAARHVVRGLGSGPESTSAAQGSGELEHASTDITPKRRVTTEKAGPPLFLDPPEQVEVRAGDEAVLRCVFTSFCVPVASCWIHNKDTVVLDGPRTSVVSSETESHVRISPACQDDAGSYTIVVQNPKGVARHTVTLNVIDCPHPPASQPVISQLSSESLILSWISPGYDGGSAITGYVVEVRREGPEEPGDWTEVTTLCKDTSYRVHAGLEPLGGSRFRVRACNAAGVSEPSEASDSVKMEATGGREEDSPVTVTVDATHKVTVDTTHKVKDHYNVLEKLGGGGFAEVFRLTHKETGQVCAGKFYKGRASKDRAAARREIELMNSLHHPKLVQCYGAYGARFKTVMVMEFIAGGELFERIVADDFEHTEPTSTHYMQQILEGIQYVHQQNIIHLDLKPENIVCVDTTGTRIKIIDFGLAHKLEPDLRVMQGTAEFVSPEVIAFDPVGLKSDMWSIGVICFILLSGDSPFQGTDTTDTLALVTAAYYEFTKESFGDISDQAKEFISSLLQKDMRRRVSCDEALAHPWIASFTMNQQPTKYLRKDKMKLFLARRKWKKTGKAVMALKRLALGANRPDSPASPGEEGCWSPDAEKAIQSLEQQLKGEPHFQQTLEDLTLARGATAHLACRVRGYPEPDVEWLQGDKPVEESSRITMEYEEDGLCTLVLAHLVPADSGVYTCRATNDLGVALCSAKLSVE